MIDVHCHILPGLDDGAVDMAESIAMARIATADGIEKVCATPHRLNGVEDIGPARVNRRLTELRTALTQAGIDLEVVAGADVHWHERLLEKVRTDPSLLMDPEGRYLLLELPEGFVPSNLEDVLFKLQSVGVTPILSHPERHEVLQQDAELARKLVERGVLLQVTAGSLTGRFGPEAARSARRMIRDGLVHIVASDAHSSGERPPILSEARREIERLAGRRTAEKLLVDNPARVLRSEPVETSVSSERRSRRKGERSDSRGRFVAAADWVSAVVIAVMIVSASLAFGGVFPTARFVLFGLGGVLAVLWTVRRFWGGEVGLPGPALSVVYLAVGALALAQLLIKPVGLGELTRRALTFSPVATRTFLSWWVLAGVVGLTAASLRWRHVRFLLIVLLLLGTFQAVYGMLEQFSGHRFIFTTPRHAHLDSVTGTYVNRNHFGGLLAMLAPVTLGFAVSLAASWDRRRGIPTHEKLKQWLVASQTPQVCLVGFLLGLMLVAVVLSLSRGAATAVVTGLSVTVLMLFVRRRTRMQRHLAGMAVVLLLLVGVWVGSSAMVHRLNPSHDAAVGSVRFRQTAWGDTIRILKDFPVLGIGAGAYETVYPLYRSAELTGLHVTYAHNDYLQFLVETGLVGGGILLVGMGVLIGCSVGVMRRLSDPRQLAWAAGLIGGLGAIAVHSFFDFNLHIPANLMVAVTLGGLLLALRNTRGQSRLVRGPGLSVKVVVFAAVVALTLLGEGWVMRELRAELNFRRARDIMNGLRRKDKTTNEPALADARRYLAEAIRLAPDRGRYQFRMGQLLQMMAAGGWDPDSVSETSGAGELLWKAEEAYRQAVELSPNLPHYQLALGWARTDRFMFAEHRFTRTEHAECGRLFRRAMRLAPQDPDVHFSSGCYWLLASCVLDPSLAVDARKHFRRSAELDVRTLPRILGQLWRYSQDVENLVGVVPETREAHEILRKFIESHRAEANLRLDESRPALPVGGRVGAIPAPA